MPLAALTALPPVGAAVDLVTYLYVREEVLALYGFTNDEDLTLFQQLLSVQGIGPRLALNLLSVLPAAELRQKIAVGDETALTRIPGVGKCTAGRLILDLRERLGGAKTASAGMPTAATASVEEELVQALLGWGFRRQEAEQVLGLPEIAAIADPGARLAAAAARASPTGLS